MEFLRASNISISFGKHKVIEKFNYTFRPGVTIVAGPNGIGKSTLLSIISTAIIPDDGEINCSISNVIRPFDIIKQGSFVPDKPEFYDFITLKEFLKLIKNIRSVPFDFYETELFDEFNLKSHLHTPFHALSFGTRKKVFLLVALAVDLPVIVLDEPTNGLDLLSHSVLVEHINRRNKAGHIIIISSHDDDFIQKINAETISL